MPLLVSASPSPVVRVPLGAPPSVVDAGVGVHGVGAATDRFHLPALWQVHLYTYTARYVVDGVRVDIVPGAVSVVPPATTVEYGYRGRSEHLYAHFAFPPGAGEGQARSVPVLQNAGSAYGQLETLLRLAATGHREGTSAASAAVRSALWVLTDLHKCSETPALHPAVRAAVEHIDAHLADPLGVAQVVRVCGVSHNHLIRLFREQLGTTVVGYIRDRRMQRARHLITASTLPVATIAASVGIPDLQAFNKTCRRVLGAAPRALRLDHAPASPQEAE